MPVTYSESSRQKKRGLRDVPGGSHPPHRTGRVARLYHLLDTRILAGDLLEIRGVFIRPDSVKRFALR